MKKIIHSLLCIFSLIFICACQPAISPKKYDTDLLEDAMYELYDYIVYFGIDIDDVQVQKAYHISLSPSVINLVDDLFKELSDAFSASIQTRIKLLLAVYSTFEVLLKIDEDHYEYKYYYDYYDDEYTYNFGNDTTRPEFDFSIDTLKITPLAYVVYSFVDDYLDYDDQRECEKFLTTHKDGGKTGGFIVSSIPTSTITRLIKSY